MLLTAVLTLACLLASPGLALAAVSDLVGALLMLSALLAFAWLSGLQARDALRWFWMLQAAGWALWFSDQMVWIAFDLIRQKKMPAMHPADALLFLAGAPMIAGLLLRPHRQPSERSARLGVLDFLLLLLWWLYLYVSFVVCWQYISPNEGAYNRNFDVLSDRRNRPHRLRPAGLLARKLGTMEDILCVFLRRFRVQWHLVLRSQSRHREKCLFHR